jgi:hypothetical protein
VKVKGCALIGAEKAANASGYATNHTAHDSADRAANGVTFRRAAFHPAGNSLCRGRDGRSEQTRRFRISSASSVLRVLLDWPA